MSSSSSRRDLDTQDGEILADLFDDLLQEILEGRTPDLDQYLPDRPDLRDRVAKTWALACSVAGRRETSKPVLGGYEILRELGHGGMGTVYLAQHEILQREVAIKVLPQSLAMSPRAKQRFLEEAKALAQIRHENVVHIHRVLDHSEMLAFEMEYIDGPSLQHVVKELRSSEGKLSIASLAKSLGMPADAIATRNPVEWFVHATIKIARALAEVHRHGLVHRDIKPANILLRKDGTAVLADFGLARLGEIDASQTGDFAGTPVYAAPERLRGGDGDVGPQTDIYSLGVTLHEMLTLSPPFSGQTTREVLRRIESGRLPDIRQQAPHVSRDLATVVQKAMEPDPRHRYATADEFADDLERLLNLEPIRARPAGPVRATVKFLRRNQRVVSAGLVGAVLVAAVTWPVVAHARAQQDAAQKAETLLHATRSALLSPESLHTAWTLAFGSSSRQPLQHPETRAAHIQAMEQVVSSYDRVLELTPDDDAVRLERQAVRSALVVARRTGGDGAPPTGASAPAQFAAGLHAFLVGDSMASETHWLGLGAGFEQHPLLDACRALQLANDGFPEQSYPRLFHATRAFPSSTALALAMAAAALEMGEVQFAEEWLRRSTESSQNHIAVTRRRLLEADLLAAKGEHTEAASLYRELAARDISDSMPLQRLASLAIVEGNTTGARRLLRQILARWPDQARARLQLAQLDLQQRRLGSYLAHVRYVVAQELDKLPRATARHLAEIPRFGGLDVASGATDIAARQTVRRMIALPLTNWLPPGLCFAIEQAMAVVAVFDRSLATAHRIDTRPVGRGLRAVWLSALSLPNVTLSLPTTARTTLLCIPTVLGQPTDWATNALLPFQTILGSRTVVVLPEPIVPMHPENPDLTYAAGGVSAHDFDGDTLPDFCLASPARSDSTASGRVELRSTADGTLLRLFESSSDGRRFGAAVAVVGDVDGDHCADLAIGSPAANDEDPVDGMVELFSGRTGERLWASTNRGPAFGASVAALSDLDGDGRPDVVVGVPATSDSPGAGQALLCSGATGAMIGKVAAAESPAAFGARVADLGDVDRDGTHDFLVTGNYGDSAGYAVVYSGRTSEALATLADDSRLEDFGVNAIGLGDVNGDGCAEFAISAPAYTGRARLPGRVLVLDGKTRKLLHELQGEQPGDSFGMAMCALPSWRRDGRPAIAISAFRGGPTGLGYVRIFDAATGQPLQTLAANPATRLFGASLIDLGDRNDDGMRDLGVPLILFSGECGLWSVSFAMTLGR